MPIIDNPLTALNLRKILRMVLVPVTLIGGMLASGIIVYTLGNHVKQTTTEDSVRNTTQFAAGRFSADELATIQAEKIIGSPLHALVVQLKTLRRIMPKARMVYILQRGPTPSGWQYLASTNTFDGSDLLDLNANGQVDPEEEAPSLGTPYQRTNFPGMLADAFVKDSPKEYIALTQSGTVMTAYSPIRNAKGEVQMLLGVEADAHAWTPFSARVAVYFVFVFIMGICVTQGAALILRKKNLSMEKQMDAERLALMELATHQLGAPLATFRWWLELLKDPDTGETLDKQAVLEQVGEGVNRLDGIVKALSNATKVGLGEVKFEEKVLGSLKHIILRAVQDATPRLKTQCLQLRVLYDDSTGPVKVDSEQFYEVMKELIDNAISFSPANTTITVQVGKKKGKCQVDVADQGYGIPEDDLPRIAEKFFRASNAAKYKPVGNGMGLYITKGIIEKHGGHISIVSRMGKGTTVSFSLKLAPRKDMEDDELA